MNLLKNAIEAIQVGVEDYDIGSRPRLHASVRNVYAGLLLMFKEALRLRSPQGSNEVLIKAQVGFRTDSSGNVVAIGRGRTTVSVRQIRERFETLGIGTDWRKFKRIQRVRNDIEHYYSTINVTALQGVLADAYVILNQFITSELREDPRTLLGEATWKELLQVSEVYVAEREKCEAAIEAFDWESPTLSASVHGIHCAQCGSDLMKPTGEHSSVPELTFKCVACGIEKPAEVIIPQVLEDALRWERYLSFTDGDELPLAHCPECLIEAYVTSEEKCGYCGHEAEHSCTRCGTDISPEELDNSPFCGRCAPVMSKNE